MNEVVAGRQSPVWIVDDERELAESYSAYLSEERAVRVFTSAEEALLAFEAGESPSVLISDIKMPGMDGLTLVRKLRERVNSTPVVLLSGYAEKKHLMEAIEQGVASFIEKPCDPMLIRREVERVLAHRKEASAADTLIAALFSQVRDSAALIQRYANRFIRAENRVFDADLDSFLNRRESLSFITDIGIERRIENKIDGRKKVIADLISSWVRAAL